jgi:hypothetical protein
VTRTPSSSWISSIAYTRGFLAVFLTSGTVLLYADTPSWLPGLLCAGTGRRSVGLAYNRLVKGRGYQYQRIEDAARVAELRALMADGQRTHK